VTIIAIEARTTEIRAQLNSAPNGVHKRGQGYRSEARTMAIEHARRLIKSGVSLVHAAKAFGISSKNPRSLATDDPRNGGARSICTSARAADSIRSKSKCGNAAGEIVLKDYRGVMMCDAYGVYKSLSTKGISFTLAHYLAHFWRALLDNADHYPELVNQGIKLISKLYAVDAQCRQAADPIETRRIERKSQSAHI